MKYKISLCISALCFLAAFLICASESRAFQEALASRISPEILRFRVVAESNRPEDQEVKLEIRSLVLDYIRDAAPDKAGKKELSAWLTDNRGTIEALSESWLESRGTKQSVTFEVTRDYFPTRTYGNLCFPCGTYDTARLTIGCGRGRNWWCVLYPSLCFTDSVRASMPEDSRRELSSRLSREDYDALLLRTSKKPKTQIRFRLLERLAACL